MQKPLYFRSWLHIRTTLGVFKFLIFRPQLRLIELEIPGRGTQSAIVSKLYNHPHPRRLQCALGERLIVNLKIWKDQTAIT